VRSKTVVEVVEEPRSYRHEIFQFRAKATEDRPKASQDQENTVNNMNMKINQVVNMKVNQVVLMYLDTDQIVRPVVPPDMSPVKGILSSYSFLFLDTPGYYCIKKYNYWCKSCSLEHGRGHDTKSLGQSLHVPGCLRSNLIVWKEKQFTVLPGQGIKQPQKRVTSWVDNGLQGLDLD
jgi:hypothetical protein